MNDYEFRSWLKSPSRTLIMGILNLTPDSFSDGGQFNSIQKALDHTMEMIEAGADIIDIGGESTRPGSKPISFNEEIQRTVPVIEEIRKITDCAISIDSYKSEVVEAALNVNANIVNDISGLTFDNEMAKIISNKKITTCVLQKFFFDNREEEDITKKIDILYEYIDINIDNKPYQFCPLI